MIRLTKEEFENLKFHFGTSRWGGTRKLPSAFTEQGVAMLSGVLRSKRAVLVNVEIMRAFVRLRRLLGSHKELARQLDELEKKYDRQFAVVFEAIRKLMEPPVVKPKGRIGFHKREEADFQSRWILRYFPAAQETAWITSRLNPGLLHARPSWPRAM